MLEVLNVRKENDKEDYNMIMLCADYIVYFPATLTTVLKASSNLDV